MVQVEGLVTEEELEAMVEGVRFEKRKVLTDEGEEVEDVGRGGVSGFAGGGIVEQVIEKVVSVAGFPDGEYAEAVEVNRFGVGEGFEIHYDFLGEGGLRESEEFEGCQRVATGLVYLSDVEEGGETVFVKDVEFKGRVEDVEAGEGVLMVKPKRGRVLVWFNVDVGREEVEWRSWHGGKEVVEGVKEVGTVYVRNCSRVENGWRREMVRKLREEDPISSGGIVEQEEESDYGDYGYEEGEMLGDLSDEDFERVERMFRERLRREGKSESEIDEEDWGEEEMKFVHEMRRKKGARDDGGSDLDELEKLEQKSAGEEEAIEEGGEPGEAEMAELDSMSDEEYEALKRMSEEKMGKEDKGEQDDRWMEDEVSLLRQLRKVRAGEKVDRDDDVIVEGKVENVVWEDEDVEDEYYEQVDGQWCRLEDASDVQFFADDGRRGGKRALAAVERVDNDHEYEHDRDSRVIPEREL